METKQEMNERLHDRLHELNFDYTVELIPYDPDYIN